MTTEQIKNMANNYGWTESESSSQPYRPKEQSLTFFRKENWIFVNRNKKIVTTQIYHSKSGKTTMIDRPYTTELLEAVFHNPRVHTKKGIYKKYDIVTKIKSEKLPIPLKQRTCVHCGKSFTN